MESIERLLKRRAADDQYPTRPEEFIESLEVAAGGKTRAPTLFLGGRQGPSTTRVSIPTPSCTRWGGILQATAVRPAKRSMSNGCDQNQ